MLFSLDALIRYEADAATIPEIVEDRGWPGFRDLEFQVVEKVARFENSALIDCGGGVVVDLDEDGNEIFSERKVEALRRNSLVVYLRRNPAYLAGRIAGDPNRPSLSDEESFLDIMARRGPWYERAAHHVIECGDEPKTALADRVFSWFAQHAVI